MYYKNHSFYSLLCRIKARNRKKLGPIEESLLCVCEVTTERGGYMLLVTSLTEDLSSLWSQTGRGARDQWDLYVDCSFDG